MKTLLIIFLTIQLHPLLLKSLTYRWLFNSIIYPITLYRVDKLFSKLPTLRAREAVLDFQIKDNWSDKYWFGKAIEIHLIKKYL